MLSSTTRKKMLFLTYIDDFLSLSLFPTLGNLQILLLQLRHEALAVA